MEITDKEKKISELTKKFLPNVKISPFRFGSEKGVETVHYCISPNNIDLINSEYFYDKETRFVHFTSLNALQSILSEKCIRLYNLNNLNDPREYGYAGDLIFFNYKNKKEAKENIFLLSMCQKDILDEGSTEIEFNLWRLYGNNGFGVAIILNFECNSLQSWKDYFLSKVHYGSTSRSKIKDYNDSIKKLENDIPQVVVDLGQIVCFHKSKLYSLEQEIRLLFDKRDKNKLSYTKYVDSYNILQSPVIYTDIAKSAQLNKVIQYLELPIYSSNLDPISEDNKIPIPKIEKIILGYQFQRISTITSRLQSLSVEKLGYIPLVEKSRLTKFYHDK